MKEADANLLSRDRLIAELRLRMPATAERDAAIAKATSNAQYQEEQYETKQALRVAQSTIGSLQVSYIYPLPSLLAVIIRLELKLITY